MKRSESILNTSQSSTQKALCRAQAVESLVRSRASMVDQRAAKSDIDAIDQEIRNVLRLSP